MLTVTECRALWHGADAGLTAYELRILKALLSSEVVTYRQIHHLRYGRDFFTSDPEANARSMVKRLRRKFRALEPGWDRIRNYAAVGYAWRPETVTTRPALPADLGVAA